MTNVAQIQPALRVGIPQTRIIFTPQLTKKKFQMKEFKILVKIPKIM
jgi:hypothetical protein